MKITEYDVNAIHTFQTRSLKSLGFNTRVSLCNKSNENYKTAYKIKLSVYKNGVKAEEKIYLDLLESGNVMGIDCSEFEDNSDSELIYIFHLIPISIYLEFKSTVSIEKKELWYLLTIQDHYVEYFNKKTGYSAGVPYQSGAFNYSKFSQEKTTIIQAPKIIIGDKLDTFISLSYTSLDNSGNTKATIRFGLFTENGNLLNSFNYDIPRNNLALISIKEELQKNSVRFMGDQTMTLIGFCENAALLPLIIGFDEVSGCIALEHTLPPIYYGEYIHGAVRKYICGSLSHSQQWNSVLN